MSDKPIVPVRALLGAALKSRAAFDAIAGTELLKELNDIPGDLWREIEKHYEAAGPDSTAAAHPELVQAALEARYTNPKHRQKARDFLGGILAEDVSVGSVESYLRAFRVERAGEALAAGLLSRRGDSAGLLEAYIAAQTPMVEAGDGDLSYLDAIKARVPAEGRIRLRLRSLNERLRGGVGPGHSIIIAGRPNSGKSALALSLAVGFARDGRRVAYVGNEDPIADLMVRAVSNITGWTLSEIEADPAGAAEKAVAAGIENIRFRQLAPGTLAELERLVRTEKPEILIVDQLRNISTKSDSYVQKLDEVARGVRNLGLKYNAVTISVTQAGDSAEGKPNLDMHDIDNSKTGIPGACDVLLMLGVTESLKAAGLRRINLVKNKISGAEESFDVRFDATRSKFTSH